MNGIRLILLKYNSPTGNKKGTVSTCLSGVSLIILLFLTVLSVQGQSKKELEKKKSALHKDIEYTSSLLSQTKKNKSASLNQLLTLNRQIDYREQLISAISGEIQSVDNDLGTVTGDINSLNDNLEKLKLQYAEMLFYAYKNQTAFRKLTFIFSATDFGQAYKRMKYLRQLSEYRLHQRDLIVQLQDSLSGKKQQLQSVRDDKSQLLTAREKEKRNLSREKNQQVTLLNNLSSKEKTLRADLKKKQRQEHALAIKIEEIIRQEIAAAQEASRKKAASTTSASASKKTPSASVLLRTPEAQKLSSDFENNKGRLPWPVDNGFISSTFGRHAHPVWRDVTVNNNGIDINASSGAKARAIFDGKVLRVIMVVDKYAVLVQHGEYFTLYSNLKEVYVSPGEKVVTRQPLGMIQTNEEEGKTEVHLEIWKGSNKMDPENWILARN